ncbi:hypothetical protein U1Q18_040292, partial [Sarracenia purpurea var. burkii]
MVSLCLKHVLPLRYPFVHSKPGLQRGATTLGTPQSFRGSLVSESVGPSARFRRRNLVGGRREGGGAIDEELLVGGHNFALVAEAFSEINLPKAQDDAGRSSKGFRQCRRYSCRIDL